MLFDAPRPAAYEDGRGSEGEGASGDAEEEEGPAAAGMKEEEEGLDGRPVEPIWFEPTPGREAGMMGGEREPLAPEPGTMPDPPLPLPPTAAAAPPRPPDVFPWPCSTSPDRRAADRALVGDAIVSFSTPVMIARSYTIPVLPDAFQCQG